MLRLFLFFPLLLLSQDTFSLPQEAEHFVYTLSTELIKADHEVYIFSSQLNEYKLIAALKKLSKKGVPIHIISADLKHQENKASYLSLLKNIHLYTLVQHEDRIIKGSLICIDNKKLYLITERLDKVSLHHNYAFAIAKKTDCKHLFTKLLGRSTKIK